MADGYIICKHKKEAAYVIIVRQPRFRKSRTGRRPPGPTGIAASQSTYVPFGAGQRKVEPSGIQVEQQ